MTEYIKTIYPHGIPRIYADKNKRNRTWSPYQYVPYYINENELLDVFITGGEVEGTFFAVVGLPSDSENLSTYSLVSGHNRITIKNSGLLSFVNNNDNGNVIIKINSPHQRVPFFNLYENSNLDFHTEMELYHDAKYVILSNKLSDIIVTYSSAKKYIKDVTKLMINYDVIIEAENKATGVFSNGKADYKLDPNRNLHIEVNHGFMFATNEYTGYNDGQGAMSQLLGLSNERWGVWHENGHQRQQFPWEWSGGTGLTEVTTNIYSLFAQEAIYGKARRIDENMPEIKRFLENNNPNKSYDDQDLFLKLGLFWQLKLAFGDQFYPQLHQLYRLMQDTPPQHDNNKQKQLFILTVSNLVNINLSPFFSKWGIDPDLNTLSHISFLPKLKKNIWEYTNDNYHQIEMPEPEYIPELIYLKNSISDVSIEKNKIKFTIDKDWYSPYDYIFERNGVYIGSVYGGQHYYCSSTLVDNGYQIVRTFSDEELLSQSDIFSIRVDYQGNHMIYYSSMEINDLWDKVKSIYTDDNFTELKSEIIQDDLNELWELYDSVNNDSTIDIRNKILFAQQLLISKLVDRDYFDHSNYTVYFNNLSFESYQFKAISGNDLIAELNNGTPVNSTINGLIEVIAKQKIYEVELILEPKKNQHD
ncbi:M60 family metallopeptidase [Providencia stuartii]